MVYEHFYCSILQVQSGLILFCHQIVFFLILIDWNSVFFTFYSNFTIRLCAQLVFAHVHTFPNIMLTEFAIQHTTRSTEETARFCILGEVTVFIRFFCLSISCEIHTHQVRASWTDSWSNVAGPHSSFQTVQGSGFILTAYFWVSGVEAQIRGAVTLPESGCDFKRKHLLIHNASFLVLC